MNINIIYKNKKKRIKVQPFESILSIKQKILGSDEILENYDIFHVQKKLKNHDYIDKLQIKQNEQLFLYSKKRGGSFAQKITFYIFGTIIVLSPIVILCLGWIPSFSSMLGVIVEKSFKKIFSYLKCNLGKKTLVSRFSWLATNMVQYFIFGIAVYILITVPLIMLESMLNGRNIISNPTGLCGPLSKAQNVASILVILFFFFYSMFRFGNFFGGMALSLCKQSYLLETNISPIISSIMKIYDTFKYLPLYSIPIFGSIIFSYFETMTVGLDGLNVLIKSISDLGCTKIMNKQKFLKSLQANAMKHASKEKSKISTTSEKKTVHKGGAENDESSVPEYLISSEKQKDLNQMRKELNVDNEMFNECSPQEQNPCCQKENIVMIGDALNDALNSPYFNNYIKEKKLYNAFVLLISAFWEKAIGLNESNIELQKGPIPDKKIYFKKILNEQGDALTPKVKHLINEYLYKTNRYDSDVDAEKLIQYIDADISKANFGNMSKIKDIKYKIAQLDQNAKEYAHSTGSSYSVGPTFVKMIMKYILIDGACNIFNTMHTTIDVIDSMGMINNVVDTLKAGTSAGIFIAVAYIISVIVLVVMHIFNLF
jgi:hypothetical protein